MRDMSRAGADNDGSDHAYRQRVDNVYQIRADKKAELNSKFKLLAVRPPPLHPPQLWPLASSRLGRGR